MAQPAETLTSNSRLKRGTTVAKPPVAVIQTTIHAGKLVKPQKSSN
jgi:hypothetical protein